jgi:hypothetical protein
MFRIAAVGLVTLSFSTGYKIALAGTVIFSAVDSGWYRVDGAHTASNESYMVGSLAGTEFRNWFVFDLSTLTDTAVAATLRVSNPIDGYSSTDATEIYSTFDVLTNATTLRSDHASGSAEGSAIFGDLGGGLGYGDRTVSAADNGTLVSVALNTDAVLAINAAASTFAIGGRLTTLDGSTLNSEVFAQFTGAGLQRELIVETADSATVPEASSIAAWTICTILGLFVYRRKLALDHRARPRIS